MGKKEKRKKENSEDDDDDASQSDGSSSRNSSEGKRPAKPLDEQILSYIIRTSPSLGTSRKKIQKHLLHNDPKNCGNHSPNGNNSYNESNLTKEWTKKDIKKSLKRLVAQGSVCKNGKNYEFILQEEKGHIKLNASVKSNANASAHGTVLEEESVFVPIAERIRRAQHQPPPPMNQQNMSTAIEQPTKPIAKEVGKNEIESKTIDLDEEIRRLEAELAADSNSDDDDDEDQSENSEDDESLAEFDGNDNEIPNNKKISFGANSTHVFPTDGNSNHAQNSNDGGIICLSTVAEDRIEPLPSSALPQTKRRVLKGIDALDGGEALKKSKKRKRDKLNDKDANDNSSTKEHTVSEGLKHAVQELLQNYVPSSHLDRPPFYCRVCQHQSTSQTELEAHRQTEFHVEAAKQEKKKTYCRLCQKQLTSMVQMEEHLKSRPHKDRLNFVRGKQMGSGGGKGRGRGDERSGAWNNRGGRPGDAGQRQWC